MVLEILFHPTVWPHTNKHECIHNVLCIYVQAIESFTFANACILYTYTHTRMHTHTDIQTYMHTCIHTHTHTHTYTYIHKYKYKYACKYMHLSLSLYIYIHVIRLLFLSLWSLKNVLSKNVLFPKKNTGKNDQTPNAFNYRPEQRGTRRVQATSLTKRCTWWWEAPGVPKETPDDQQIHQNTPQKSNMEIMK